jgi:hypothetical protein
VNQTEIKKVSSGGGCKFERRSYAAANPDGMEAGCLGLDVTNKSARVDP